MNMDESELLASTVAGMSNRQKLQKHNTPVFSQAHSNLSKRYMKYDKLWAEIERKNIVAYEYLCHLQEVKNWIETILQTDDLGPVSNLDEILQDGVVLATLLQKFAPEIIKKVIKEEGKLKFKRTDNISLVLKAFEKLGLPKTFWFEMTDLYERKNIPKVIYSINALSHLLNNKGLISDSIQNLVGKLEFSDEMISITQGKLEKVVGNMPKFDGIKTHFTEQDTDLQKETVVSLSQVEIKQLEPIITEIQAVIKEKRYRLIANLQKNELLKSDVQMQNITSRLRSILTTKWLYNVKHQLDNLNKGTVTTLQSCAREHTVKRKMQELRYNTISIAKISNLQAMIRGHSVLLKRISESCFDLKLLKTIHSICRTRLAALRKIDLRRVTTSESNVSKINTIITLLKIQEMKREEEKLGSILRAEHYLNIVRLQAVIRGESVIDSWHKKIDRLGAEEDILALVQAGVRRELSLRKYEDISNKYPIPQIISLQSLIRAKQAYKAYYELAIDEHPKIPVIKTFLHLIEDSEKDYSEELLLEKHRMQIIRTIKKNRQKEDEVAALDVKIGLLVRNKISLDEVIMSSKQSLLRSSKRSSVRNTINLKDASFLSMSTPNLSMFKAIDKQSQERLQHYSSLFYILQTCPIYLAKLLVYLKNDSTLGIKLKKFVESVVLTLFGLAQNQREEFFLLKLFKSVMYEELSECEELQDLYNSSPLIFTQLSVHYNRGIKERLYLKELLKPLVKLVIQEEEIDLETDPISIYKESEHYLTTQSNGTKNKKPEEITIDIALNHEETKQKFIKNLQQLRNIACKFVDGIVESVDKVPYGIRYISRELKEQLLEKYGNDSSNEMILKIVGNMIYYRYINPAIVAPELFDVIEQVITPRQRRNLGEIAKILNQISICKLSEDKKNHYMQPLNAFIQSQNQKLITYYEKLFNVESTEQHFQMDEFYDLTTYQKPCLFITQNEILTFHQLVKTNLDNITSKSNSEDILRTVIENLGSMVDIDENDIYSEKEIMLRLNTKFMKINNAYSNEQELFIQTKRYVIHILKVQIGSTLLDILSSETTSKEEEKHRAIAKHTASMRKTDQEETEDITLESITFEELKYITMENMEKLEQTNLFDLKKENNYQQMIRYIALDVKHKNKKRMQRTKEIHKIKQTEADLLKIARYLDDQIQDYSDYIQTCVSNYAKGKKHKKSLPSIFSRQYIHNKRLERSGKKPIFNEYKYTALRLHNKGIIKQVEGYNEKSKMKTISIIISCNEPGVFLITVAILNINLPNSKMEIKLEELLQYQYENITYITLFQGLIEVNVNLLMNLINKKFYT